MKGHFQSRISKRWIISAVLSIDYVLVYFHRFCAAVAMISAFFIKETMHTSQSES